MGPLSRRDTLRLGGGALGLVALPGCSGSSSEGTYPAPPPKGPLIDVHAHFFNGTDLPVTTFLTRLFLKTYDPEDCTYAPTKLRIRGEIENPTPMELAIQLAINWMLSATPTARVELARLKEDRNGPLEADQARVRRRIQRKLARFLAQPTTQAKDLRAQRDEGLRDLLWQEASESSGQKILRSRADPRQAADQILTNPGRVGAVFSWTQLFFRSRQSLAQELVRATVAWERKPLMLVPLMVDYAHWLGETTSCGSSFEEQVAVYGEISRRSHVPIHGFVAFDPLRAVFWQQGKHDRFKTTPEFDPLDLARRAVTEHGFVGLKVYPPMGFQATGNSNDNDDYPDDVIAALQPISGLGDKLDAAMEQAFDLCLDLDVPILAHATNSLAAGPGYGARAEPRHWIKVLETRPGLRLCLAHGSRFCWQETAPPKGTAPLQSSWEWTIGRYVRDNPSSHLYMDISYLSALVNDPDRLPFVAEQLKDWIDTCDREARHILYGTDWTMLGIESGFKTYGSQVVTFLRDRCHLTDAQLDRVLWQNAFRFLGLDRGKTRARLLDFYGTRRPAWTEMQVPEA